MFFWIPRNAISIEQIVKPDFQKRFKPSTGLTFGYTKSAIWLKVFTKTNSPDTQWYLEIPAPFLEYVDFYQLQHDGTWQHAPAGYYRKQSVKKISHTGHVVPLIFDANSESTVFIKISGQSPKTFPLFVLEKEKFHEKTRREDIGHGIFYGILIVMFFYNLLLYLVAKGNQLPLIHPYDCLHHRYPFISIGIRRKIFMARKPESEFLRW